MNYLDNLTKEKANRQAIYNVYSYLSNKGQKPQNNDDFKTIVDRLKYDYDNKLSKWKDKEKAQLDILVKAIENDTELALSKIGDQISSVDGINGCTFTSPNGDISVVFRGTGNGEWIDNGEGLSGIPEENTYITYDDKGREISRTVITEDYATDQQVEALNWFNKIASKNGWTIENNITISGHSKGGNKAQFITINSDLIDDCYSFDGQGFSPEALALFEEKYDVKYKQRREKILGFSAYNDYVNILGGRLIPKDQVFYFEAPKGDQNPINYHYMDAMLDESGRFNLQCEKGELSEYIEEVSNELMDMESTYRQYATLGIMNVLQKYLGRGTPVNGDSVSLETTVVGCALGGWSALEHLLVTKEGNEALLEVVRLYGDDAFERVGEVYRNIGEKYGVIAQGGAVILSTAVVAIAAPFIVKTGVILVGTAWATNTIKRLGRTLEQVSSSIYNGVKKFYSTITNGINNFIKKNFNSGYKEAGVDPLIVVDTDRLRRYADRLEQVNNRLKRVDTRMDNLYLKVGLRDLFKLIQADWFTGSSKRVLNCVKYLDQTADDFDSVERKVSELL